MAYATVSQLEDWLDPEPVPANAARLLEQASDRIDTALWGVAYPVGDPEVQAVLAKACVRQVHWVLEGDDETGARSDIQSESAGKRSYSRFPRAAGEKPREQRLAPSAVDVLRNSGLLAVYPAVVG